MGTWTWQVEFGLIGGVLVFAAVLVPAVVVQYRRYGRLSGPRLLGLLAVAVYAVALAAYVFLPLPDPATVCARRDAPGLAPFQSTPFAFVGDIRSAAARGGWRAAVTGWATWQVLFNVALFVPLGVIVRRYLGRGVLAATVIGLAVSAAIELTQWSAVFGLYPCSYRVGDVDDLIANTTGALVGALVAPALLFWMPQARDLALRRRDPRAVTVGRRWLGMVLDWAAYALAAGVLVAGVTGVQALLVGRLDPPPTWAAPAASLLAGVLVFGLPALIGSGASIGQAVVWLAPRWSRPSVSRRLARAAVTGGVFVAGQVVGGLSAGAGIGGVVQLACWTWVAVCLLAVPFTTAVRGRPGLSGLVSGASMVDVRANAPVAPVDGASDRDGPARLVG